MATVNKSSLRAEFDALKARFESLCAAGKMSAESRALFDALLMLFELLMAVFMEKHTPKSSANSSLPASQSPNDDTARTRPGAKGKGPSSVSGHYGPWLRGRAQCDGGSWWCGPRSDRRGASANSDFHMRGVSSVARLAGCTLIRWSTSTR